MTPVPSLEIQAPHSLPLLLLPLPGVAVPRPGSCRFPSLPALSPANCRLPRPWPHLQLGAFAVCGGASAGKQGSAHPTPGAAPGQPAVERTKAAEPLTVYLLLGHRGGACGSGRSPAGLPEPVGSVCAFLFALPILLSLFALVYAEVTTTANSNWEQSSQVLSTATRLGGA